MRTVKAITAIAIFGVLLLPFPSQILAQETPAQQPSVQQPSAQQSDLNDSQLRSFAKVYVQVEKILQTYEPRLKEAKTPEENKQLQSEEMSKIDQVLTQEGMDEQSYHRIVEIANGDDTLRKKLIGFINEERQKS